MKTFKITKKTIICVVVCVSILLTGVFSILLVENNCRQKDSDVFVQYYNNKCQSYSEENKTLEKGQIVFLGDSLTEGCTLGDYYSDLPLKSYNRGIGGDTTNGLLNRLKVSAYEVLPSKIVILIGGNDILRGFSNARIARNYKKILNEIKDNLPNARVYCVSILPISDSVQSNVNVDKFISKAKVVNDKIETLANERGYGFIDIHSDFANDKGYLSNVYTTDGVHLTQDGYLLLSSKVKNFIK